MDTDSLAAIKRKHLCPDLSRLGNGERNLAKPKLRPDSQSFRRVTSTVMVPLASPWMRAVPVHVDAVIGRRLGGDR